MDLFKSRFFAATFLSTSSGLGVIFCKTYIMMLVNVVSYMTKESRRYLELFFKCSLSSVLVNNSQCFHCHTEINSIYLRLSTNNMLQHRIININILSLDIIIISMSDRYFIWLGTIESL